MLPSVTDEQIEKLWHQKLSFAQIAERLGVSKGAVAGKVYRLRLKRGAPPGLKKATQARLTRNRQKRTEAANAALGRLAPGQCRWPIGDPGKAGFGFCGARCDDPERPYCEKHRAQAYIRYEKRK